MIFKISNVTLDGSEFNGKPVPVGSTTILQYKGASPSQRPFISEWSVGFQGGEKNEVLKVELLETDEPACSVTLVKPQDVDALDRFAQQTNPASVFDLANSNGTGYSAAGEGDAQFVKCLDQYYVSANSSFSRTYGFFSC
jgi:hypothetical protein